MPIFIIITAILFLAIIILIIGCLLSNTSTSFMYVTGIITVVIIGLIIVYTNSIGTETISENYQIYSIDSGSLRIKSSSNHKINYIRFSSSGTIYTMNNVTGNPDKINTYNMVKVKHVTEYQGSKKLYISKKSWLETELLQ